MIEITRIAAIAKNESAYIADWVHHHLFFGFDQIKVYVNRSDDHTEEILKQISNCYPCVSYENFDWIDLCDNDVSGKLQKIAYAKDLKHCQEAKVDNLLFIDVDEYWTPADFSKKVNSYLSSLGNYKSVSFEWLCEVGRDVPFSDFPYGLKGFFSQNIKTLFKVCYTPEALRIHFPLYNDVRGCLDSSGAPLDLENIKSQKLNNRNLGGKPVFLVHRMFRSELEYLATIVRGNPEDGVDIKRNRPGYKGERDIGNLISLDFDNVAVEKYLDSRSCFYNKCNIESLVSDAQKSISEKGVAAREYLNHMRSSGDEVVDRLISGLRME